MESFWSAQQARSAADERRARNWQGNRIIADEAEGRGRRLDHFSGRAARLRCAFATVEGVSSEPGTVEIIDPRAPDRGHGGCRPGGGWHRFREDGAVGRALGPSTRTTPSALGDLGGGNT